QALYPDHQHDADDDGDGGEEPALPAVGIRQKTEGGASVVSQGPVEIAGHHLDALVQGQAGLEEVLAQAVGDQHQQAQQQPGELTETSDHGRYSSGMEQAKSSPSPPTPLP